MYESREENTGNLAEKLSIMIIQYVFIKHSIQKKLIMYMNKSIEDIARNHAETPL